MATRKRFQISLYRFLLCMAAVAFVAGAANGVLRQTEEPPSALAILLLAAMPLLVLGLGGVWTLIRHGKDQRWW